MLSLAVAKLPEGSEWTYELKFDGYRALGIKTNGARSSGLEMARTSYQKALRAEVENLKRRYELLTPREREVFQLVTAGLLNKQTGAELGTTERTVKAQHAQVMFKMKAKSLAELVRMADQLHI